MNNTITLEIETEAAIYAEGGVPIRMSILPQCPKCIKERAT